MRGHLTELGQAAAGFAVIASSPHVEESVRKFARENFERIRAILRAVEEESNA